MGMKTEKTLAICNLTRHQYYYKPKAGKPGVKASTQTLKLSEKGNQQLISNQVVVDEMINIKQHPDTDYGYRATTAALLVVGFYYQPQKSVPLDESLSTATRKTPQSEAQLR